MIKILIFFFCISSLYASDQQTHISGELKLFYYDIDSKNPNNDAYTTAIGGYLDYRSSSYKNLFANIRFYTSHPTGPNKFRESTLLYQTPSGDSIDILAIANITYKHEQTIIKLGRQRLFTPMANDDTTRIIPYTYTGVTLTNHSLNKLKLQAGYIKNVKPITSEDFLDSSPSGELDNGFFYLGANIQAPLDLELQAFGYYANKLYDAMHLQLEREFYYKNLEFDLGIQYIQTSSNDSSLNLIKNSNSASDDVNLWAYKVALKYDKLTLAHSFSKNEGMGGIVRGYGGYTKVYTSSMYETAKSQGGAKGLNFTIKYDFSDNLKAETIYLKTTYKDPTANPYVSIYGGLKYFYAKNSYIFARFENVERKQNATSANYFRLISTFSF